jgi:hypothetical protein
MARRALFWQHFWHHNKYHLRINISMCVKEMVAKAYLFVKKMNFHPGLNVVIMLFFYWQQHKFGF